MRHNLGYLLKPASIAIIGANDKGNVGARAVRNAKALGFAGAIYPVNPKYKQLQDLPCYPSLAALPQVPDRVVVAVPAPGALDVVTEAAEAGVPAAVVFSEGFADAGTARGKALDHELNAAARACGMAVSGPNSMGLLSLHGHVASTFMNLPERLRAGGISVISQSGGLINALVELGRNRGIGFNYLLSTGNESVVDSASYMRWLADDPHTEVIISILEGVKRGAAWRAALEYATQRKPVVILKLGRTELGERATLAHTGSLAGGDAVFRALCEQSGASLVDDIDSLLDAAAMLASAPLPGGDRVVIFSTSGGATVLTSDLGVAAGLNFPPLSQASSAAIQEILEVGRPFGNPFDVVGNPRIVKGNNMTRCLETLVADEGVDAIAFVLVLQRDPSEQRTRLLEQIRSVAARSDKPIIVIPEMTIHWRDPPPQIDVPIAGSLRQGLKSLRALIDYAAHRRRAANIEEPVSVAHEPARPVNFPEGRRVLTEYESKRILEKAGFPVPPAKLVHDLQGAVAAAETLGYPVALKLQSARLMHKTDAGALALGLKSEADLRAAYLKVFADVRERAPDVVVDGVLVERMVQGGVELFLGMKRDETFGPVVVFGLGGVFVELFGDATARRLPPFGRDQADAMIGAVPAAEKLLAGYRGRPPADRGALVSLIEQFARFAATADPAVAAIDLNPVMLLPRGKGAFMVDASFERR